MKAHFIGHAAEVRSLSFSPNGEILASTGPDGTLRLWDTNTGEQEKILAGYKGSFWGVLFSPAGEILASQSGSSRVSISLWREIWLWDVIKDQKKKTLTGHLRGITSTSFSPDRQTLASAGEDGTVLLWDLTTILNTTDKTK